MDLWRDHIRPHPYPRDLDSIAREFGPQLDGESCGPAAVRHGLLLGGLTIPEGTLKAIFRSCPDGVTGDDLSLRLQHLGLEPDYIEKPSKQPTSQFFEEKLGPEMDRGAFVLACIYGGNHWITLGRWQRGRIRAVDSHLDKSPGKWGLGTYSLTPEAFDHWDWEDCVQLVRPGIWWKNYEEWLPGRNRLLRLAGPSAPMELRLQEAAHVYLNDDMYSYERLELFLSDRSSPMVVEVEDPGRRAISVSMATADEPEELVVVVRRLAQSEPGRPGPPELICRIPRLCAWQLR